MSVSTINFYKEPEVKIISLILFVFFLVWELPQNILGCLFFLFIRKKVVLAERSENRLFIETEKTGVSLGWFVFWTPSGNRFPRYINDCRMHEYGHSVQSKILGPFYLLVIGIPSLLRVWYRKQYLKTNKISWPNYYAGFPENWADRISRIRPGLKSHGKQ